MKNCMAGNQRFPLSEHFNINISLMPFALLTQSCEAVLNRNYVKISIKHEVKFIEMYLRRCVGYN